MQFHKVFTRYVGTPPAGGKPIASDVLPVDGAGNQRAPSEQTEDNCLYCGFRNLEGWPVHRVAVAYKAPAGAVETVTATMYIWESQLGAWIQIGAAGVLTPGQVTFFDCVALLDTPATLAGLNQGSPTRGSMAQLIIIGAGAAVTGAHTFALGADLSTAT